MRYEIIVEWFDTKTELDRMATYPGVFGSLAEVKEKARWYLKHCNRGALIPDCCRVEDDKETVVARFEWVDDKAQEVRL